MAAVYFPLRRKGASLSSTAEADYKIVSSLTLSAAQGKALSTGGTATIGGTAYVLAQPLPGGATGFPSKQGAASYLLGQTPGLGSASWMKKYSGSLWERLVAGIAGTAALGAGDGDDGSDDEDGTGPDDDEDEGDDSTAAQAAEALSIAGLIGALEGGNLWGRAVKIIVGAALVIVGLSRMTGASSAVTEAIKKVPVVPV